MSFSYRNWKVLNKIPLLKIYKQTSERKRALIEEKICYDIY